MTHAEIQRAGDDGHRAVGLEMNCAQFLAWRGRHFEVAPDAKTAQQAALLALALALLEAGIVGCFQRLLEHAEKVAAVVGHVRGCLERQIALADHVALAQLDAIDAHLGSGKVEHAFDVVISFRPAGAAIGGNESRVGEHALCRHFHHRRAVDAREVLDLIARRQ